MLRAGLGEDSCDGNGSVVLAADGVRQAFASRCVYPGTFLVVEGSHQLQVACSDSCPGYSSRVSNQAQHDIMTGRPRSQTITLLDVTLLSMSDDACRILGACFNMAKLTMKAR